MKSFTTSISFLVVLFFVQSCLPEDNAVAPSNNGAGSIQQVDMGRDYDYRLFYSLGSQEIVGAFPSYSWDLAFDCSAEGFQVRVNSAKVMRIGRTQTGTKFAEVADTNSVEWYYDPADTASITGIGKWYMLEENEPVSVGNVYVVDRGYNGRGRHTGYSKIQLLGYGENGYSIQVSDLEGGEIEQFQVLKDPQFNFVGVSFDSTDVVQQIEPEKYSWDIVFARYTHVFFEPVFTAYAVTGVLANPLGTCTALDTTRAFEDITFATAQQSSFECRPDALGFEWKYYDLDQGEYIVFPELQYVVKTWEDYYYKMRFVDFYNESGKKGAPKFEVSRLVQ